jgi:putative transposase
VARIHERIACIRRDFWHKATTLFCRENQTVVVEDLTMSLMLKNRHLARAASDVGLGSFRPMLRYKSMIYGGRVVEADRFFPSTQRCCRCGNIKTGDEKMVLGQSKYECSNEKCGCIEDRDRNAAKNLEQYPRLEGNWGRVVPTPTDDRASTRRAKARQASVVDEVGTNQCSPMSTI